MPDFELEAQRQQRRDRRRLWLLSLFSLYVFADWSGLFFWIESIGSKRASTYAEIEHYTCTKYDYSDTCKRIALYATHKTEYDYRRIENYSCARKCLEQIHLLANGGRYVVTMSGFPFTKNRIIEIDRDHFYD